MDVRHCLGYVALTQSGGNVEGLVLASSLAAFVWGTAAWLPMLALSWRRLHDARFSGPLYFLGLIPFFGPIIFLFLMLLPTTFDKRNREWEYVPEPSDVTCSTEERHR